MKRLWLAFALAAMCGIPAQAQVKVDAAKITCEQFSHGRIGKPGAVGYWLSGYVNAKQDNSVIDVEDLQKNVTKLKLFCLKHHDMMVMEATKQVFGQNK